MPFLAGFGKRKEIRYGTTFPGSNLSDFPKLLKIVFDSDIATELASLGGIALTQDDGETLVPFGLYPSSDFGSGNLIIRAKFPSLLTAASTGEVLGYLYYDAGATTVEDHAGVVDNGYTVYMPFEEDPSGSAPQMYDWVSESNIGTTHGSMTSGDVGSGTVGYCLMLDGANGAGGDYITLDPSTYSPASGPFTLEANFLAVGAGFWHSIFDFGNFGATHVGTCLFTNNGTGELIFTTDDGGDTGTGNVTDAVWHHGAGVFDGGTGLAVYVDGVHNSSANTPDSYTRATTTGAYIGGTSISYTFPGHLDEIRISSVARSGDWLEYQYEDDFNNEDTFSLGAEETDDVGAAFLSGFNFRKEIRYGTEFPAENLTDFPKLLIIDSDSDIAAELSGGGGIAITEYDGETLVPFGLYPSSDPTSGDLIIRAKFPSLLTAASTGAVLGYIYYDADETTDEDKAGVVSNDYVVYMPLEENPGGSSPQIFDWVSESYLGVNYGLSSGDLVAGQVGNQLNLDGFEYIVCGSVSVPGVPLTLEAIIRSTGLGDRRIITTGTVFGGNAFSLYAADATAKLQAQHYDGSSAAAISTTSILNTNIRHGVAGVFASTTDRRVYVDGVNEDTDTNGVTTFTSTGFDIGVLWSYDGALQTWSGDIDEVRISSVARSDNWLEYQYIDDFDNADTFSLGAEEESGGASDTGDGSASVSFTAAAVGISDSISSGATSVSFTASAASVAEGVGNGATSVSFTTAAVSSTDFTGSGLLSFSFTAAAASSTDFSGSGSASVSFTAAAVGVSDFLSIGASSVSFTASATSRLDFSGSGSVSVSFAPSAVGISEVRGSGSTSLSFTAISYSDSSTGVGASLFEFMANAVGLAVATSAGSIDFSVTAAATSVADSTNRRRRLLLSRGAA